MPVLPDLSKILVLGTNPYAEVLIDAFEGEGPWEFVGFLENMDRSRCATRPLDLPVYWSDDANHLAGTHKLVSSLHTTLRNSWIDERVRQGFVFQTLAHPAATVSGRTKLGAGVVVEAGCVVAGFCTIGAYTRIGRAVTVGHHTEIGDYSTINPGAILSGNCRIGSQVTIGTGAVIINGLSIGSGAFIAAGSLVSRDVPPRAFCVGSPSRIMRKNYGPK